MVAKSDYTALPRRISVSIAVLASKPQQAIRKRHFFFRGGSEASSTACCSLSPWGLGESPVFTLLPTSAPARWSSFLGLNSDIFASPSMLGEYGRFGRGQQRPTNPAIALGVLGVGLGRRAAVATSVTCGTCAAIRHEPIRSGVPSLAHVADRHRRTRRVGAMRRGLALSRSQAASLRRFT